MTALGEIVRWRDGHGQEHRELITREIASADGSSLAVWILNTWLDWPIDPETFARRTGRADTAVLIPTG